MDSKKRNHTLPGKRGGFPGRFLGFIGTTLAAIVLILLGVIWVLERGPSPTLTARFCQSVRETSAIRWLSNIFLTEEELAQYVSLNTENDETDTINTSLIHISETNVAEKGEDSLELIDITMKTCKGKLLIVKDPKRVMLGTSEAFGTQPGLLLTEMVGRIFFDI